MNWRTLLAKTADAAKQHTTRVQRHHRTRPQFRRREMGAFNRLVRCARVFRYIRNLNNPVATQQGLMDALW
jgi:hypothetical protein